MLRPAFLTALSDRFETRTLLRRRMNLRLGLVPARASTPARLDAIRATMAGCMSCPRTLDCTTWLNRGGGAEAPWFCPARNAFARLQAV
jgi:hypothetical protein